MTMRRRSFLKFAGIGPIIGAVPRFARAADDAANEKADHTLRIGTGLGRARARPYRLDPAL